MNALIFIGISITLLLRENLTSAVDQPGGTTDTSNPPAALTCVVIGDVACNCMCKMVGHIFATPVKPAHCNQNNNCECSVLEHQFLDDLWKDKFSSIEILDKIKASRQLYDDVKAVMKTPFKTREQTKQELEWIIHSSDFEKLQVNDNVAENMIKDNGRGGFDHDNIRAYVNRSLQSVPLQLPEGFDFKARFLSVLENTIDEDTVLNIINDVRQTKNAILNQIVDTFVQEKKIEEDEDDVETEEDAGENLTDILDLMIVDKFISPSPITNEEAATSTPTQQTNQKDVTSQQWDLDLPNLDVPSVTEFKDGYKCWDSDKPQYLICQFKTDSGESQLWWKKGNDAVNVFAQDTGEVAQEWRFANGVKISLSKKANNDLEQTWNFVPDTQLMYIKSGNAVDEIWSNGKKDEEALVKYKSLIDLWCDKNTIFIERESCVIY